MGIKKRDGGFVYLMHAVGTDLYKIGHSGNPHKRLYALNQQSAVDIKLMHAFFVFNMLSAEEYFHDIFKKFRIRREWFALEELQLQTLTSMKSENGSVERDIHYQVVMELKYFEKLKGARGNV